MSDYRIETKCIQSGYEPGNGEPRVLPIYQSTTFKYSSSDQMGRLFDLEESGYFYTRLQNPTNDFVAQKKKYCKFDGYDFTKLFNFCRSLYGSLLVCV